MTIVEVRCPVGPRKLFTRLKLGQESGGYVRDNCIEFTCWDCAKMIGRDRGRPVRVYHRFNFIGQLVETSVEDLSASQ